MECSCNGDKVHGGVRQADLLSRSTAILYVGPLHCVLQLISTAIDGQHPAAAQFSDSFTIAIYESFLKTSRHDFSIGSKFLDHVDVQIDWRGCLSRKIFTC